MCIFLLNHTSLAQEQKRKGMGSREDTCLSSSKMPMHRTTDKKKPTCVSSQFSKAPTLVGGRHNIRSLCFSFFCSLLASIITNFCLSEYDLCHEIGFLKWISTIPNSWCFAADVYFSTKPHISFPRTEDIGGWTAEKTPAFWAAKCQGGNNRQEKAYLC